MAGRRRRTRSKESLNRLAGASTVLADYPLEEKKEETG